MSYNSSNVTYPAFLSSNMIDGLILMSIMLVASLVCNGLLIITKFRQGSKITFTSWLIVNLAISDLGFMLVE